MYIVRRVIAVSWLGFVIMKICLSLAFIEMSIGYCTRTALKSNIIT